MGQYAPLLALAQLNGRRAFIQPEMHATLAPVFRISLPVLDPEVDSLTPWQHLVLHDWMSEEYSHLKDPFLKLSGFPCSWTFSHHLREEIHREFTLHDHLQEGAQHLLRGLRIGPAGIHPHTFVGVHVRRGDYLEVMPNRWKGVVGDRVYLQQAMDWFQAQHKDPIFVVTSNGMKWCLENIDTSHGDLSFNEEDFEVTLPQDVGTVLMLRAHKAPLEVPLPLVSLPPDAWFCNWFQLEWLPGAVLSFPCYQWLEGAGEMVLREGTAKLSWEDHHPKLQDQRQKELKARQKIYRWKTYIEGWPHCLDHKTVKDLDLNIKYSASKNAKFFFKAHSAITELKIKGLLDRTGLWRSLKEMRRMFNFHKTPAAEYVFAHWQEDAFFASQFLNGINPVLIRRCCSLPKNFPVTDEMVAPVLGPGTSLQAELEKGSLYLVDHGILSGVQTNVINGKPQFSAAPMTLLYQSSGSGPLLPIAIQLKQTPGPDNPIFLPSDDKWDWLLAKTWVRNAEFSIHEPVTHLLHAHLIPEVFALATLRQLPQCHPLFKLLIPHLRYTLHINTLARELLIAPGKVIDKSTGLGVGGFSDVIKRNMEQLNYSVLCLPEDIQARDVGDIPGYYYRDDGLKIWGAIKSFVSEIVGIYYPSDASVRDDQELQAWVREIFSEGFLGRESSGMPSLLDTQEALVQYITMVIFTCSAKHAAVSAGQFDSSAWMPNLPPTMQLPPPTSKGQARPEGFLATLPTVSVTCYHIITLWLLSKEPGDQRPLGHYPDEHFTEDAPRRSVAAFQRELTQISSGIRERNQSLALPYTYLDPPLIENSVSI